MPWSGIKKWITHWSGYRRATARLWSDSACDYQNVRQTTVVVMLKRLGRLAHALGPVGAAPAGYRRCAWSRSTQVTRLSRLTRAVSRLPSAGAVVRPAQAAHHTKPTDSTRWHTHSQQEWLLDDFFIAFVDKISLALHCMEVFNDQFALWQTYLLQMLS